MLNDLMKDKLKSPYDSRIEQRNVFRDLFYWAILFNRKEMAKLFWELDEEPISKQTCSYA